MPWINDSDTERHWEADSAVGSPEWEYLYGEENDGEEEPVDEGSDEEEQRVRY